MNIKISILCLFLISTSEVICQNATEIIDPVNIHCYRLKQEKIDTLILDDEYTGKVVIAAYVDTITCELKDHHIVFGKFWSSIDPKDSIVIRMDHVSGNNQYIEKYESSIVDYSKQVEIEETFYENCVTPMFNLVVIISNKK